MGRSSGGEYNPAAETRTLSASKIRETIVTSVKLREEAEGKILILTLSGKLQTEDYAHFTPEVERAVQEHGKIRLLVIVEPVAPNYAPSQFGLYA